MAKKSTKKRAGKGGRKASPSRSRKKKAAKVTADGGQQIKKLEKLFAKDPVDGETFSQLWDHYLIEEAWAKMEKLLNSRIAAVEDRGEKVRCLLRLASLYDEKLIELEKAIDVYHQVINLDSKNRQAIWALGHLYHDLEDWEKVIEIYLLQISLAENPIEKLSLRAQLAQVFEERLQQHDQALMEYIRAVRLAPENVRVLLEMEKLATRTESFRELLAVYEDVVERITRVDLKTALYLKLARLWAEHLENSERSDDYYRKALDLCAGNPEQLFSISEIYGEEEEWEELIATYTQLIRQAELPEVKTKIRREISRLYRDGLNDLASAFFELVRVARYNPEEPGLAEELYGLGTACDKHLELAAVLEDIGARLTDEDVKAELYTRLARLHLEDLQNADMARVAVCRVLDKTPAYIPAQILRFDLLEAGREYEALAEAIESFLARPDLPDSVASEQRKRLARIYEEKLDNRSRAVELFKESLHEPELPTEEPPEEQPEEEEPEESLEELYREQGAWDDLISLLGSRMDEATDPQEVARTALEIAKIQEEQLGLLDDALVSYRRAAEDTSDHQEKLRLLFKAAELLEEDIGDAEGAAELYEDILLLEPESAPAQEALFRLHQQALQATEPSFPAHPRKPCWISPPRPSCPNHPWHPPRCPAVLAVSGSRHRSNLNRPSNRSRHPYPSGRSHRRKKSPM
jgi:tetratricopeptide (TPR) repeat protein